VTPESNSQFPTFDVFPNHNSLYRLLLEEREADSASTRSDDCGGRSKGCTGPGKSEAFTFRTNV
jgi:hypothetical protein